VAPQLCWFQLPMAHRVHRHQHGQLTSPLTAKSTPMIFAR
jgi:hypothetical protein